MTEIERKALALVNEEAIAWANKVIKAKGTSYTPASRNAAAFILASCDRIEALEAEVERLTARVAELEAGLDEAIDQLWHLSKDGDDNYLVRHLRSIRRAALEARHD